jgi:hypothetical protein
MTQAVIPHPKHLGPRVRGLLRRILHRVLYGPGAMVPTPAVIHLHERTPPPGPRGLTYRGRAVEDMTREELVRAIYNLHDYYEGQLAGERATAEFALEVMRRRSTN